MEKGKNCSGGKGTGGWSWTPNKYDSVSYCCEKANILPRYLSTVYKSCDETNLPFRRDSLHRLPRWVANSEMWKERTEKQVIYWSAMQKTYYWHVLCQLWELYNLQEGAVCLQKVSWSTEVKLPPSFCPSKVAHAHLTVYLGYCSPSLLW